MPAGCIVPPDTEKSIQIDFENMIDVVKEMTHWLSVNNSQQAFDTSLPLIGKLFDLHRALILGDFTRVLMKLGRGQVVLFRPDDLVRRTEKQHIRRKNIFSTSPTNKWQISSAPGFLCPCFRKS
jgi:hypothetical protein